VRALAVSAPVRSPWTPEVPTFTEQGFPGFEAFSWVGFFADGQDTRSRSSRRSPTN
jgi:tripartite-type tricarboxylate transporter receptor subunit TctC